MAEPLPLPKGYQRLGSFPIDKDSVFTDLATMEAYIAGGSSYAGHQVFLVDAIANTATAYNVLPDKSYEPAGGAGLTIKQSQDLTDSKIENIFFASLSDFGVITRPYDFMVTSQMDSGGLATIKTSSDEAYVLDTPVLAGDYLKVMGDTLFMRVHLTIERTV